MTDTPAKEPMFNAPLLALFLPLLILGAYALEITASPPVQKMLIDSFALNPILVRSGQGEVLFTYMFLHGSWPAVLFNAAFIFVCGASLARAVGRGWGGVLSYIAFFELCGIASGLAFCLAHMYDNIIVIGASGAMSGLLGAAMRLPMFGSDGQKLKGLFSSGVIGMTVFWCIYNLYMSFGSGAAGQAQAGMAWESHLAGYFLGLFLIEPWLKAFHPRYFVTG